VVARLSSGAAGAAPDPMIQPRWHVHFPVRDLMATVDAALRYGGSFVVERSTPRGPEVALRDAEGSMFTLTTSTNPDRASG
jgi:predicted enzyme related to lactoylglutathione lyase